jgi:ethanolamine utilization cobalamin adenosyltransferase
MKAVTEAYLRNRFREGMPQSFALEAGMILTPAARQYLRDNRIELTKGEKNAPAPAVHQRRDSISREGTKTFSRKPEEMTQLHGNTLVRKDHPRIHLRGRLDSLQSDILLLHARIGRSSRQLAADLADLLVWARQILRAEVLETPLPDLTMSGLSAAELRERSHNPRRFFDIGHVLPEVDMAPEVLELNRLRSTVREIELAAVAALADGDHPTAQGIIEALNRMSSALYVLMLKWITKNYDH